MKTFRAFILVLAGSVCTSALACGFYPYGEDVRFCFFRPHFSNYYSYSEFDYSSEGFKDIPSVYKDYETTPNEALWLAYCKNKVNVYAVREVLDRLPVSEITPQSSNAMVRYLYRIKDIEAIDYLKFAKTCELFNAFYDDPWERDQQIAVPKRARLIEKAVTSSKKARNPKLQLRYAFLSIRLAFYNGDYGTIRKMYDTVFSPKNNRDILDYWSLYFRTFGEINAPLANFYACQVFAHAPEKRFVARQQYNPEIPVEATLQYAKTDEQRANVLLVAGIRKHGRAIEDIKQMHALNPGFDGLNFLLLREVNKIEDWIYTPHYTLFNPSISSVRYWDDTQEATVTAILNRVGEDRKYAAEVLAFIDAVDLDKVSDKDFWRAARVQLLLATRQYENCLASVAGLQKRLDKKSPLYNQLDMIKAICLIAKQPSQAVIPESIKPVILKNKDDNKFIFAIGRELEYSGNTTEAALFYSNVNKRADYPYWFEEENSGRYAFWRTARGKGDRYSDYFSDYFDYINVFYTPRQMQALIADIKSESKQDAFSAWEYSRLKHELPRLYDLLGTKYIRQNKLPQALANFEQTGEGYWDQYYSGWERSQQYGNVFDANPFYTLKYTPEFIPATAKYKLTKASVTRHLIGYLKRAQNPAEKNRDYYYFLVANCYYNMTQYGNSWMMRRYYWSSSGYVSILEDEEEFFQCNFAKQYYALALGHAKTEKFRALCLRMLMQCESKWRNGDELLNDEFGYKPNMAVFAYGRSDYYSNLFRTKYPKEFRQLTDDCSFFADYFKARR